MRLVGAVGAAKLLDGLVGCRREEKGGGGGLEDRRRRTGTAKPESSRSNVVALQPCRWPALLPSFCCLPACLLLLPLPDTQPNTPNPPTLPTHHPAYPPTRPGELQREVHPPPLVDRAAVGVQRDAR